MVNLWSFVSASVSLETGSLLPLKTLLQKYWLHGGFSSSAGFMWHINTTSSIACFLSLLGVTTGAPLGGSESLKETLCEQKIPSEEIGHLPSKIDSKTKRQCRWTWNCLGLWKKNNWAELKTNENLQPGLISLDTVTVSPWTGTTVHSTVWPSSSFSTLKQTEENAKHLPAVHNLMLLQSLRAIFFRWYKKTWRKICLWFRMHCLQIVGTRNLKPADGTLLWQKHILVCLCSWKKRKFLRKFCGYCLFISPITICYSTGEAKNTISTNSPVHFQGFWSNAINCAGWIQLFTNFIHVFWWAINF